MMKVMEQNWGEEIRGMPIVLCNRCFIWHHRWRI